MTEALKLIVDGYLSLKNREAIEDLRAHRQRLRKQLEERTPGGIDAGPTMQLFDEELHVIQAALASF